MNFAPEHKRWGNIRLIEYDTEQLEVIFKKSKSTRTTKNEIALDIIQIESYMKLAAN